MREASAGYGVALDGGVIDADGVVPLEGVPDDDVPLLEGVLCAPPPAPGVSEPLAAVVFGNGVPLPGPPEPVSIVPQATGTLASYEPLTIIP
jgi:hypothetical protein